MATTVYVISDLHLGGSDDFQMCSPEGRRRLAEFLDWVTAQAKAADIRLVLAGDVVDFLAEDEGPGVWRAFTGDEERAVGKLNSIVASSQPVWTALANFVAAGGGLTIQGGNHDIELSLPAVRRRLTEVVAPRGGRLELLLDGEAFRQGRLVVEHGNAYDPFNAVAHDELRHARSRLSRGMPAGDFHVQPGSELVVTVMNPIKKKYAFIDLLKPETSGAIPILAVLSPSAWLKASSAIRDAAKAGWRRLHYAADGTPPADLIANTVAATTAPEPPFPDEDALELADELAHESDSLGDRIGVVRDVAVALLLKAFRKHYEKDHTSFKVDEENRVYLAAAKRLAKNRFDAVVFGHTHHAKRIALDGGATYLNSGTWADLIRIPSAVYAGDEQQGLEALKAFLASLERNEIENLRRPLSTFVRVELDDRGKVSEAQAYFFDRATKPDGSLLDKRDMAPVSTAGALERLDLPAT